MDARPSSDPVGAEAGPHGVPCRICAAVTNRVAQVDGAFSGRAFDLRRCEACGFAMISDPLDPAGVYDEAYYAGRGADPLVDYHFELAEPAQTVRQYEWRGIAAIVAALSGPVPRRWMDYGCGNGGLVRHLRAGGVDAMGFEEGGIVPAVKRHGIPLAEREALGGLAGTFDVVTAVEVLEHTLDPLAELRTIRSLLRPGGIFFATTGNAAPYRQALERWRYVVPEIHISFFEPVTLARAFEQTGFRPVSAAPAPGWDDVYRFKLLKNLRVQRRSRLTDRLPAAALGRGLDRVLRLSDLPAAVAI